MNDIFKEESVMTLYKMACTVKEVIEENYKLREENKALKEDAKQYRATLDDCLVNAKKEIGQWLSILANSELNCKRNNTEG